MKKLWSTFFAITTLGWLLTLGAAPAAAYYSPLPATATFASNSVTRTVFDPRLQQDVGITSTFFGPNVGVVDLQQDRGVMAWIYHTGTAYYVTCSVYDPGDSSFKEDTQGPFGSVSQLEVQDGVVIYLAGSQGGTSDTSGSFTILKFATYDAARGVWKYQDKELLSGEYNFQYQVKDGVVAGRFSIPDMNCIDVALYDPVIGEWTGGGGACKGGPGGGSPINYLMITNGTVYWQFEGESEHFFGYQGYLNGGWQLNQTTKPLAYFAAKPQSAWAPPLWVWFTDMSIAATQWNWNFGDNSTSSDRSPHHTYTSSGIFQAQQVVNGGSACKRYIDIRPVIIHTWSGAYTYMVNESELEMLRQYRDEVMTNSASGRQYQTMLYNNSEAALRVLLQNPEMLITLKNLIKANKGAIRQVLKGREGVIDDPEAVEAFLKTFGEKSPQNLRALANNVRKEMRQQQRDGQPFLGFRLRR